MNKKLGFPYGEVHFLLGLPRSVQKFAKVVWKVGSRGSMTCLVEHRCQVRTEDPARNEEKEG